VYISACAGGITIVLAVRTQTPGNYPKRNILHLEHGESLKTGKFVNVFFSCMWE